MTTSTPLGHVKVLDVTHFIAGPYCTKLLADYGADVVKVERPGTGDPCRRMGPFPEDTPHQEKGGLFLFLNTSKKGITLDLNTKTGQEMFKRLAAEVDVVVENFRPGVMSSWGLDFATLAAVNSELVMVSITNFGQTGPYRDYKAAEITEQAMGGLMYGTGLNSREPLKVGLSQAQFWAGIMGAAAALTGVFAADFSDHGQHMDVSIMECVASGLQASLALYSYTGMVKWRQQGEEGETSYLPCKDGYVLPGTASTIPWEIFANCLEAPELLGPKFAKAEDRARHSSELALIVRERLKEKRRHEIFHRGQESGLPFAMVQEPEDLANCPQLRARGFWANFDHPVAGTVTFPGAPFKLSESPWQARRPAPTLGQHNEEVYASLGYTKEDLCKLRGMGIV